MTTMPFGKWKDTPLDKIPPSIFRWALQGSEDLVARLESRHHGGIEGATPAQVGPTKR